MIPQASIERDRLAIVGTSGSGKSYLAMLIAETLMGLGRRVIIIDPLGAWFGLRLLPDGSPSPFKPVIFGGAHGDIAIGETAGKIIGETVATSADSCIIDMSQFPTSASERRFMLAFLTALYAETANSPVHLFIDEADMFAPQFINDHDGDSVKLLGMVETVVRRGRIKGFIPTLITQRPAVLNKNVMSQADGLIAMKLTSSQDRTAIGAWVDGQADKGQWKAISAELPTLKRGSGVVWLPGRGILETMSFGRKLTFDSSRTPEHGETFDAVKLVPIDIGALRDRLASVEQETKANDPRALKAEIARLKSEMQNTSAPSGIVDEAHNNGYSLGYTSGVTDGHRNGYLSGVRDGYIKGTEEIGRVLIAHLPGVIAVNVEAARNATPDMLVKKFPLPPLLKPFIQATGPKVDGRGVAPKKAAHPSIGTGLSKSAKLIVDEIHKTSPTGISFAAAARRAGVSKTSSAYRSYLKEVLVFSEICGEPERLRSAPGFGSTEAPTEGAGVDNWVEKLPPPCNKILRAISLGLHDKKDICSRTGISPTSSALGSGLNELIRLDLIYREGGNYYLAEGL